MKVMFIYHVCNSQNLFYVFQWYIQATCATQGNGLYEGLDWLSNELSSRWVRLCSEFCLTFTVGLKTGRGCSYRQKEHAMFKVICPFLTSQKHSLLQKCWRCYSYWLSCTIFSFFFPLCITFVHLWGLFQ